MTFEAELRRQLAQQGMSLRALARQVPVDVSHLSRILRGERAATMQLVQRCEEILHAPGVLQGALTAQSGAPVSRAAADPTDPAAKVWNVAPPVLGFTGRDAALAELETQLNSPQAPGTQAHTAVVSGMPGIGKTQLARAFAESHRPDYAIGWWVTAETALETRTGLSELAARLGAASAWSAAETLAFLFDTLARRDDWLLVFDNAPAPAQVEEFLPRRRGSRGHVLITSRSPSWQAIGVQVPLEPLDLDDAVGVLTVATGARRTGTAHHLAEELGRLPLALAQAAAYTAEAGIGLEDYLALFRQERSRLLALGGASSYPGSVRAAIALSSTRLADRDPLAHRALEVCALWAGDLLPIRSIVAALPTDEAKDNVACLRALAVLRQSGLLTPDTGGDTRLHRLTRLVVRDCIGDLPSRLADAVHALTRLFPAVPSEPASWPQCARLTPHARALLAHAQHLGVVSESLALLFTRLGRYLLCTGLDFATARQLHEQALCQRRALHAGDHPETARALVHLAVDLNELGHPDQARSLHEQALGMRRRLYPDDHLDTAHSLDNLGNVLHRLGEHVDAREHHAQGLAMRRRLYPDDHPDVAYSLNNLAADLRVLGEVEQARTLDVEALQMRVRLDLGDHPDVAHSLSNLAADLLALDDHVGAVELEERSLQMRLRLYPSGHPQTTACQRRLNVLREPHLDGDTAARSTSEATDQPPAASLTGESAAP